MRSSPVVADGRVYVGSNDYKIYCFGSAITRDDIMNKLESLPGEDQGEIKNEVDSIKNKLDDCCEKSNSTNEEILSKLNKILEKLGLAVGGIIRNCCNLDSACAILLFWILISDFSWVQLYVSFQHLRKKIMEGFSTLFF